MIIVSMGLSQDPKNNDNNEVIAHKTKKDF